jgi:hypothetical protein
MKTHKVLDMTYHEDEGNEVYVGTQLECLDWVREQDGFGYEVVPLTREEIILVNEAYKI